MGIISGAVLQKGGEVTGVVPEAMVAAGGEVAQTNGSIQDNAVQLALNVQGRDNVSNEIEVTNVVNTDLIIDPTCTWKNTLSISASREQWLIISVRSKLIP